MHIFYVTIDFFFIISAFLLLFIIIVDNSTISHRELDEKSGIDLNSILAHDLQERLNTESEKVIKTIALNNKEKAPNNVEVAPNTVEVAPNNVEEAQSNSETIVKPIEIEKHEKNIEMPANLSNKLSDKNMNIDPVIHENQTKNKIEDETININTRVNKVEDGNKIEKQNSLPGSKTVVEGFVTNLFSDTIEMIVKDIFNKKI